MRRLAIAGALGLLAAAPAGCFGNEATPFPPGLEPWEENRAPAPAPVAGDACPEQLTFLRTGYMGVRAVHARACVHAPLDAVFRAARDPQTGRDPTTTDRWWIVEWETEPEYDFSYKTHVYVDDVVDVDFDLNWRHGVVEGTLEAPTVTAARWQKTFGTTAITTMEGSLVLRQFAGDPTITALEYQYHLDAASSGHDTIEAYLAVIYARLRDRAHGVPLVPDDCPMCPEPPPGY